MAISDYYNNSMGSYGQIPVSNPNLIPTNAYQPQSSWGNSNVYAPWDPDGAGPQAGSFNGSAYGVYPKMPGYLDTGWMTANNSHDFWKSLGAWDFKGGKKRANVSYTAPSYQGSPFIPREGLPQYYSPSLEGANYNNASATVNPAYSPSVINSSLNSSLSGPSYDYNYSGGGKSTMPDYIGQPAYPGYTPYTNSLSSLFKAYGPQR